MGNSFGEIFRITTWGESHGGGVGVAIAGCPPRIPLREKDIQPELDRRRPGQSKIVTQRDESDKVRIVSGTFKGKTLGTPIALLVENTDQRSEAYTEMEPNIGRATPIIPMMPSTAFVLGLAEGVPAHVKRLVAWRIAVAKKFSRNSSAWTCLPV